MQQEARFELIVVNDGTSQDLVAALETAAQAIAGHGRLLNLPHRRNGHGPSFVLNFGAAAACGEYLCFLDDDDEWTDPAYLAHATLLIASLSTKPDLLFYQQIAVRADGSQPPSPVWIEGLQPILQRHSPEVLPQCFPAKVEDLMTSPGFAHVNTTIVRHDLFAKISGFDTSIRYENDRDFYLRAVDAAEHIFYIDRTIARHYIPKIQDQVSASLSVGHIDKFLYQIHLGRKSILFSKNASIRQYSRNYTSYVLRHLSVHLYKSKQYAKAASFAMQALAIRRTNKWLIFTTYLVARRLLSLLRRSERRLPPG